MALQIDRWTKPAYRVPLMSEIAETEPNGLEYVSTFSGCGGSTLGFRMAGWKTLLAGEFIPAAQETYALNNPGVPVAITDIREMDVNMILAMTGKDLGELDCLEGSPPCASFSTAGKRSAGWGEVRKYSDSSQRTDDLFYEYARLLKGLQPRSFVAENVTGLIKGAAKGYYKLIHRALEDCGYRVAVRDLNAAYLGVPQARRRVIFVGIRNDLGVDPPEVPYQRDGRGNVWSHTVRDAIPLAVRHGTAPPHKEWVAAERDLESCLVPSGSEPSPTIVASGENKGAGYVEVLLPVAVVHDRGKTWHAQGDVTDRPCPTITVGVDGLNSEHYKIEQEVVRIPADVLWEHYGSDKGSVADRPAPAITAHGISGGNDDTLALVEYVVPLVVWEEALRRASESGELVKIPVAVEHSMGHGQFHSHGDVTDEPAPTVLGDPAASGHHQVHEVILGPHWDAEAHEEQKIIATLDGRATGPEWDKLEWGGQSERYFSLVRVHPDKPCPTVTTATAFSIGAAGVAHPTERRKFTIPELKRICAFPDDFILTGNYRQQWERLGRAVPPVMMKHVAAAVAEAIL